MGDKQVADRRQFRRYAEAALNALVNVELDYSDVAAIAFQQAAMMMLLEQKHWEECQLKMLELTLATQRERHGIAIDAGGLVDETHTGKTNIF